MALGKLGARGGFGSLGNTGKTATAAVIPGPGGVGSPMGLLLLLTYSS